MSIGGGKSKSETTPVTWEKLMTPQQQMGMFYGAPGIIKGGVEGLQGQGLSMGERGRQTQMLSGQLADYASGQREGMQARTASMGQRGGVVSGMGSNIDAAKMMAFGEGLRSIEDMNQRQAQQKIHDLMSFVTWNAPVSQQSKSSSFDFKASKPV